jgi:hypothetical protein
MLTTAVICTIAALAVFAAVLSLYAWWRLERLADQVYRLGWDLDALAGSFSRSEGYEAPERPDN